MLDYDDFVTAAMLEEGVIDAETHERATRMATERGKPVLEVIVSEGLASVRDVALVRAGISECPFVDLSHYEIDLKNAHLVQRSVAERHRAFPLFVFDEHATLGMADPLDLRAVDQLRSILRRDIEPVLCEEEALAGLISRAYSMVGGEGDQGATPTGFEAIDLTTGEEPIVAAVNQILAQAAEEGASDIHIGPDERDLHLRLRVDGTLRRRQGPPLSAHAGIVQRLKVMANLDLTQTRRPQDGKFRYTHAGRKVDCRLSVIPTVYGENVVIRLLSSAATIGSFDNLGFPASELATFQKMLEQPHGMILVTGPTGSGKTTTLYTGLKRLNSPDVNIMTIEDPVEIRLPMIRQVQANPEVGLTFAGALRSILRQDPDVVLVGEIRDEETARIALQAALTGHLVLSTLHTNDAPGAVARLRDFGCPPFAINGALLGVLAQRLVRRSCESCARPYRPEASMLERFGLEQADAKWTRGAGCARCLTTGYRGRVGIYELLEMTRGVQRCVEAGASTETVRDQAVADGMKLMHADGVEKARMGLTTLEEVARVAAVQAVEPDEGADGQVEASRAA